MFPGELDCDRRDAPDLYLVPVGSIEDHRLYFGRKLACLSRRWCIPQRHSSCKLTLTPPARLCISYSCIGERYIGQNLYGVNIANRSDEAHRYDSSAALPMAGKRIRSRRDVLAVHVWRLYAG